MKVLSDWQKGKPPMCGFWIVRWTDHEKGGLLAKWNGRYWCWPEGPRMMLQPIAYRGLAFNPESAIVETDGQREPARIVIQEFTK